MALRDPDRAVRAILALADHVWQRRNALSDGAALMMPWCVYRELRIEAGCEDPGPPPDGYDEHSIVRIADGEARLMGDDTP